MAVLMRYLFSTHHNNQEVGDAEVEVEEGEIRLDDKSQAENHPEELGEDSGTIDVSKSRKKSGAK
jgi:hypothetical protein